MGLRKHVDTILVIPNQNLFKIANEQTTFEDSFNLSNNVLMHGVQSITDLMVRPGLINLDFADVETVMASMGKAMMGTGEAEGEGRALKAAEMAVSNPLIDDYTLKGAKGLLVNITGGKDLKLFEVDEAVNKVRAEVDPEAELIIGAITDSEQDEGHLNSNVTNEEALHSSTLETESIVEDSSINEMEKSFTQEAIETDQEEILEQSIEEDVSNDLKEFGVDSEAPDLFSSETDNSSTEGLLSSSEEEEDDLEIPAFLRRQKN